MQAGKVLAEIIRIAIVFLVIYALIGWLGFSNLYQNHSFYVIWSIHMILAVLVCFIWYRYRGRYRGWV